MLLLESLPNEILLKIAAFLGPVELFNLSCCNSSWTAFSIDSLWSPHLHWELSQGIEQGQIGARKWFKIRSSIDCEAMQLVQSLVEDTKDSLISYNKLEKIGLNGLERISLKLNSINSETDPNNYICFKYYLLQVKSFIARKSAITVWQKIANSELNEFDGFEQGLWSFTAFRQERQEYQTFEQYTRNLRLDHSVLDLLSEPHTSMIDVLSQVESKMSQLGYKPAAGMNFHDLDNHFLNVSSRIRGTLPMSLISVFCSVIKRLPSVFNIQAFPIGFPGRMLALVRRGEEEVYVDCFTTPFTLRSKAEVVEMGRQNGSVLNEDSEELKPASPTTMVLRVARNILTSIQQNQLIHSNFVTTSLYSAALALFILLPAAAATDQGIPNLNQGIPNLNPYASWICSIIQSSQKEDVSNLKFLLDHGSTLSDERKTEIISLFAAMEVMDQNEPEPTIFEVKNGWRIGSVFQHRANGYYGVIRGGDLTCEASDEWKRQMNVSSLRHGAYQPFFNVLADDGSNRYVALENLVRPTVIPDRIWAALLDVEDIGLYFLRRDIGDDRFDGFEMNNITKASFRSLQDAVQASVQAGAQAMVEAIEEVKNELEIA